MSKSNKRRILPICSIVEVGGRKDRHDCMQSALAMSAQLTVITSVSWAVRHLWSRTSLQALAWSRKAPQHWMVLIAPPGWCVTLSRRRRTCSLSSSCGKHRMFPSRHHASSYWAWYQLYAASAQTSSGRIQRVHPARWVLLPTSFVSQLFHGLQFSAIALATAIASSPALCEAYMLPSEEPSRDSRQRWRPPIVLSPVVARNPLMSPEIFLEHASTLVPPHEIALPPDFLSNFSTHWGWCFSLSNLYLMLQWSSHMLCRNLLEVESRRNGSKDALTLSKRGAAASKEKTSSPSLPCAVLHAQQESHGSRSETVWYCGPTISAALVVVRLTAQSLALYNGGPAGVLYALYAAACLHVSWTSTDCVSAASQILSVTG